MKNKSYLALLWLIAFAIFACIFATEQPSKASDAITFRNKTAMHKYCGLEVMSSPDCLSSKNSSSGQMERQNNEITAVVSAYSSIDSCHTGSSCLMANGERARVGAVACPSWVALGTQVEIDGVGVLTCADRTADYVNGRYDVFLGYGQEAYQKALAWGVQYKTIKIL